MRIPLRLHLLWKMRYSSTDGRPFLGYAEIPINRMMTFSGMLECAYHSDGICFWIPQSPYHSDGICFWEPENPYHSDDSCFWELGSPYHSDGSCFWEPEN